MEEVEDKAAFGDELVYCNQHLAFHATGWCSVGVRDKVGLGTKDPKIALDKCYAWGFKLYHEEMERLRAAKRENQ